DALPLGQLPPAAVAPRAQPLGVLLPAVAGDALGPGLLRQGQAPGGDLLDVLGQVEVPPVVGVHEPPAAALVLGPGRRALAGGHDGPRLVGQPALDRGPHGLGAGHVVVPEAVVPAGDEPLHVGPLDDGRASRVPPGQPGHQMAPRAQRRMTAMSFLSERLSLGGQACVRTRTPHWQSHRTWPVPLRFSRRLQPAWRSALASFLSRADTSVLLLLGACHGHYSVQNGGRGPGSRARPPFALTWASLPPALPCPCTPWPGPLRRCARRGGGPSPRSPPSGPRPSAGLRRRSRPRW